jgi:hypothetical protein
MAPMLRKLLNPRRGCNVEITEIPEDTGCSIVEHMVFRIGTVIQHAVAAARRLLIIKGRLAARLARKLDLSMQRSIRIGL